MNYKTVRGTYDLYGESIAKFNIIEKAITNIAHKYSYGEIRTPIFEHINVFEKNIGDSTDIVNKEMYCFQDRNDETLCLRPEGTASVVRALLTNKLVNDLPLKFFYMGPMFRYERPQKGRQRQFQQLGFEYLGGKNPFCDAEMISLANDLLINLGISNFKIHINSLGSPDTLKRYKEKLVEYLQKHESGLSEDSKRRLLSNPLRVLDSKDDGDKQIVANAPKINEFYSEEDNNFYNKVKSYLETLNISYVEDPLLVRGLDYYTSTVFEIITESLGSQGTLIAGGRYDNLVSSMKGPQCSAFGFAGGIDRISLMLEDIEPNNHAIAIATEHNEYDAQALSLCKEIVNKTSYSVNIIEGNKLKAKFKKVDDKNYKAIIIIGEKEYQQNVVTLKNLQNQTSYQIKEEEVVDTISGKL